MRLKFSPVCLMERLQVHLFLWLCGIKIRNQRITVRLLRTIVRGMLTFALMRKYGFRDYRGGGRSSGRETIGRVAAGAIAVKMLSGLGIKFLTYTRSIGPVTINEVNFDAHEIYNNSLYMLMPMQH